MADKNELSAGEIALLGLLAEGPAHAWQLEKQVEYRDMRSWTDLSTSSIYRQLNSLEAAGRVSATEEIADGRLRKVYTITGEGEAALQRGLLAILEVADIPKERIDLVTYNIDVLPPVDARAALKHYGEQVRDRAKCWGELEAFLIASGCPRHRLAIARRRMAMLEGELRWLDEFIGEVGA